MYSDVRIQYSSSIKGVGTKFSPKFSNNVPWSVDDNNNISNIDDAGLI